MLRHYKQKEGRAKDAVRKWPERPTIRDYSWEPESPPPSPLEETALPPPPAAAFCCFSRASRMRALREIRTLCPSLERTFTSTWPPSFSSSKTTQMRCSEISLMLC